MQVEGYLQYCQSGILSIWNGPDVGPFQIPSIQTIISSFEDAVECVKVVGM